MMLRKYLSSLFIFLPFILCASEPEMADVFRSNGKIYVVVVVISIIFAGITIYLIGLDRKIRRLEKKEEKQE